MDQLDNDRDGMVDCMDDDCTNSTACGGEDCVNGLDDNNNGLTDCADPASLGTHVLVLRQTVPMVSMMIKMDFPTVMIMTAVLMQLALDWWRSATTVLMMLVMASMVPTVQTHTAVQTCLVQRLRPVHRVQRWTVPTVWTTTTMVTSIALIPIALCQCL